MSKAVDITAQVITNLLLFLLVMGLASTVDIKNMKAQLKNFKAIGLGLFCQFFLLPFLGWAVIEMFKLPVPVGITLLVVVSSPGGSYSNWWCSLLNADLALSVAMTTFSTILSVAFLPMICSSTRTRPTVIRLHPMANRSLILSTLESFSSVSRW